MSLLPLTLGTIPVDAVAVRVQLTGFRGAHAVSINRTLSTIYAALPVPSAPDVADWSMGANLEDTSDPALTRSNHSFVIALAGVTAVRWNNQPTPPDDRLGVATTPEGGGVFRMHTIALTPGTQVSNIRIRVTRDPLGYDAPFEAWSDWSLDTKTGPTAELGEGEDPGDPVDPPPDPEDPVAPDLDSLPRASMTMRTSIDMGDGVVWTFNKSVPCYQSCLGEWAVRNTPGTGGLRVTQVSPNSVDRGSSSNASFSQARMHGLMRDPIINRTSFKDRSGQGFDEAGEGRLNGNWMGRHMRYEEALNLNPNLKGDIVFADGEEGSLYKALSLVTPDNTSRSCFKKFFILTVMRDAPPEGFFRPSPDRDVKSKKPVAVVSQLDLVDHPTVNITEPIQYSVSQTKRYLTGPFMAPALGARPNTALYGRDQTFEKNDPLYNAVFGQGVNAGHAHIMNSATGAADRREILAKMCQIGLDVMQTGALFDRFEYSPAHSYSGFVALCELAAACLDNPIVRQLHTRCVANNIFHEKVLKEGRNPSENGGNPGTGTKTSLLFIDETDMWFRTPPEGTQSDVNWNKPIQTPFIPDQEYGDPGPYTGGHIGMPFRTGSGSPNGGFHSNMNMSYTRLGWVTTPNEAHVCAYSSPTRTGVNVVSPVMAAVHDRYARYFQGHHDGAWSLEGVPQFVNKNWTIWDKYLLELYNKTRGTYVDEVPVWLGRPEQPFPPLVSRPGSGQMRIQFLSVRVSNNGALTGAQYRIRRVKASNVSGSWQQNTELRERVFYNTPATAWGSPVDISTTATVVNLSGLAAGIWQVQWRLQNASGWGPWSTNCGWAGDERASAGLPAGPRAVILI